MEGPRVNCEVKTTVTVAKLPLVIGALLMIAGVVIPASTLIELLRTTPGAIREQLILGATLFKAGLVLDGLFIVILGWMMTRQLGKQHEKDSSDRYPILPTFLVGILITAFLLRLYNLNFGIWFDEIVTYVSYMDRPFGEILTTYDNQNNHILYTLLARLSFLTLGESVWSLRLPAVLFGVGSVWALYLFSCEMGMWREGLLAAGLLTFSYHHVWFSQNARGYTALLFWTMLSSWLLVRALREAKVGLWLMYGLTTALGVLTHITMAFVVVGQGVVYLASICESAKANRREKWLGGFLGFAVAGLLTFQLYSLVLPQLFNWQGGGVAPWQGRVAVSPWKSPMWMIGELFNGMSITLGSSILVIVAFLIFGAGLIDFLRKESLIVYLLVVPVLVSFTVIMGMGSTLLPRFFFFAMGFAVLIVVHGLLLFGELAARLLQRHFITGPMLGVALCTAVITISAIAVPRAYLPKQDYGGAIEFVQEKRRPGDVVVTVGLTVFPYQRFYKVDWRQVATLEELNTIRSRGGRTWLVYTMPIVLNSAYPEIMKSIQIDFEAVREFPGTLSGGNIVVALAKT
jgi:mannosyltransferase